MKKKQRCLLKRFAALVAALLIICCMSVPALAATDSEADMPSYQDFYDHPFSWYVWKHDVSLDYYELICTPLTFASDGYLSKVTGGGPYSVTKNVFRDSSGDNYQYLGFPTLIELRGVCGSWRYYPSFPLGDSDCLVKIYPFVGVGFQQSLIDNNRYCASICPSPEFYSLQNHISFSDVVSESPMLGNNQRLYPVARGPSRSGNSYSTGWVSFSDLQTSIFSSSTTAFYLGCGHTPLLSSSFLSWDTSTWQGDSFHFSTKYSFPSSSACIWFCLDSKAQTIDLKPNPDYLDPFDSTYLSNLWFYPSLFVPARCLPDSVEVGDWISHGTMDQLQDQLVNDFDVNSDTLKNSKQNFESWQNSNTIDTDVADTSLYIINGLMQNVGQFAFVVSLLCFGAVVLRVLIRKAVEG